MEGTLRLGIIQLIPEERLRQGVEGSYAGLHATKQLEITFVSVHSASCAIYGPILLSAPCGFCFALSPSIKQHYWKLHSYSGRYFRQGKRKRRVRMG